MADVQSNIGIRIDTSSALASIKLLQSQLSAFQTSMSKSSAANAAAAANMQQNLINNINATGKFNASIKTVKSTTESFTNALEKNKLSLGQYFKYSVASSKTFGKTFKTEFDTINKVARERVKDLQTQYIKLGRDANGAMRSIAVRPLALDMDNLGTKTAIAAQRQQLLNQMLKQGSTNLLNFGKNTQWAGRQLMVGFSIPIGMAGAAAAKAYMDIERASVKIKRVYGDLSTTAQETNKMVDQIKNLATEYTRYGIAVADTMEMAATAAAMGKTGADLLAQVASASKLAALGGVEQGKALETTISITDAFGISADKLAGKINFLNAVENQTVTSIEDLTIAVPKAGPVIQQLGGDVEDLAFLLTAMREGGINASEGANALKSGLASLINPTEKASNMLAGYGINIKNIVESNKGDVKGIVVDFAKALDTLDPLNRARAIEQMFGKFQFARLSTLFQNVNKQGSQAQKALELANMSSIQLAAISARELKKLESSPMYKFQKAVADLQTKIAPIGETFLNAVTPVINFVSKILDGFNGMSDSFKQFAVVGIAVVGGLAPVLLMLVGLVANGAANIIKLFANIKSFFNGASTATNILGEETRYMTQEQIEAAAVAASLDQTHSKLIQTFTSEASAVRLYTQELQRASAAAASFNVPGMSRVRPTKKLAGGGLVSGPGTGTSDSIPALVSNGEFVMPAKQTKKYFPILQGMVSNNLPGFNGKNGNVVGGASLYGGESRMLGGLASYLPGNTASGFGFLKSLLTGSDNSLISDRLKASAVGGGFTLDRAAGEYSSRARITPKLMDEYGAAVEEYIPQIINELKTTEASMSRAGKDTSKIDRIIADAEPRLRSIFSNMTASGGKAASAAKAMEEHMFFPTKESMSSMGEHRVRAARESSSRGVVGTWYRGKKSPFTSAVKKASDYFGPKVGPEDQWAHYSGKSAAGPQYPMAGGGMAVSPERQKALLSKIASSAGVTVESLMPLMQSAGKKIGTSTVKAVESGLTQAEKAAFRINSPSKEEVDMAKARLAGFKAGMSDAVGQERAAGNRVARRASLPAGQTIDGQFYPVGFSPSGGYNKAAGPQIPFRQNVKRNFSLLKSGKKTISGGKIAGAGFGASIAMGAASMIPGPIGQFAATLSPIIGILSMFGGVISKILPVLLRFAGPIGLAITAIGGLITIVNLINDAKKKEKEKTDAVADAADLAGKALSGGLSKAVGLSGSNNLLNAAAGKAKGMNVSQVNDVNTLLTSDEFSTKKGADGKVSDTGQFITKLKTIDSSAAASALLDSVAMGLLAQGATDQVVNDTITAIKIAAGKKDLKFDVKSIKLGTVGGQNNLKKNVDTLVSDINKYSGKSGTGFVRGISSITNTAQGQDYGKMTAAAKAYGSVVSQVATSVSQMFASGQISAKDFHASLNTLTSGFGNLSEGAQKLAIAQAFKNMDPSIVKVKNSLKDTTDQMQYLLLVSMGGSLEQGVIDQLNSSDAKVRAKGKENLKKALADAELFTKEINKILGDTKTPTGDTSGGGNKATNLRAQLTEQIKQSALARQLMTKGASSDFADFLSKADKETRDQYIKSGTTQLTAAGKALQAQYSTKGLEDFKLKQATLLSGFKQEKTTRDALVQANLNYLDAAKAATDETVRAAMANALSIKNEKLRKKAIQEVVDAIKTMNGEQAKSDMTSVNTGQVQSIRDSYNQVIAYDKLIKSGSGVTAAYEAVQDAATASAIAQETNTGTIEAYIKQARILQALQQKAKGADQAKMDYANLKIDVKQSQVNTYQDAVSLLQADEQKINDVYDKRIEALDKIISANEEISAQQQGQLDLAEALSRGDIAAAARSAQDMRQQSAKSAVDQQKKLLSDAKDAQVKALTVTVNGQTMTMKMLNDKITTLTNEINSIKLKEVDPAAESIAQKALDNAIVPGTEDQVIANNGGLSGLIVDKPIIPVVPGKTPAVSKPKAAAPKVIAKATTASTKVIPTTTTTNKTATPAPVKNANPNVQKWIDIGNNVGKVVGDVANTAGKAIAGWVGGLFGFSSGGVVPNYLSGGGTPSWAKSSGTDTIPSMLTPGEFVVKKSAVDSFGLNNLKAINNGTYSGESVYNYELNINVKSDSNANDIARTVMTQIKQIDSQRLRGNRL